MVIIDLILIAVIVVFIIDISGIVNSIKSGLKWVMTKGKLNSSDYRLKPFDCSLCMNFWTSLIYLLIIGKFTLPYIACVCVICCFLSLIKSSIYIVRDVLITIIEKIYKIIENDK